MLPNVVAIDMEGVRRQYDHVFATAGVSRDVHAENLLVAIPGLVDVHPLVSEEVDGQ